jgi:hypothetical protein
VGLLDDAIARGRDLADNLLAPVVADPEPLGLNPTLRTVPSPTSGQREPIIKSAQADNTGVITVALDPVDPATSWGIDYLVVSTTSNNKTSCVVYDSYVDAGHIFDGTDAGNAATAFYSPSRKLSATRQLIAVWVGANPGDTGTLRCEYHVDQA